MRNRYVLTIALLGCTTTQTAKDLEISKKIVGVWATPPSDVDGHVPSQTIYFPTGHFELSMMLDSVHCEGRWWVAGGKLYNEIKEKTPTCTFAPAKTLDVVVSIGDSDLYLLAEDGLTLHRVKQ